MTTNPFTGSGVPGPTFSCPYKIAAAILCLVDLHQDLDGFLAHIEEARRVNKFSHAGKVTLMTIHQAKGLEFRCVIVPGLNEGILPHINSVADLANMERR